MGVANEFDRTFRQNQQMRDEAFGSLSIEDQLRTQAKQEQFGGRKNLDKIKRVQGAVRRRQARQERAKRQDTRDRIDRRRAVERDVTNWAQRPKPDDDGDVFFDP